MKLSRQYLQRITGGSVTVGVNDASIVYESSDGVAMAFPDVCKIPSPGGSAPIPYPDIASSSDTAKGTKSVKISDQAVGLKGSAYFKMSESDE